ncbi:hypothetical protein SNE40_009037 [Patella caerulea]|uniref:Uncharacterized protein n=1 Tax=Patella caerulea TaxID=87958 RepID=A0AAN8PXA7_PATCE
MSFARLAGSSSPFQNVPSTPLTTTSRRRVLGDSSPTTAYPQHQTLYSSPYHHTFSQNSQEYVIHDEQRTPSAVPAPFEMENYGYHLNLSLISENASTANVEQVVPATPPGVHRGLDSSPHTFRHPLHLLFRINSWSSMTPRQNVASYQQRTPEYRAYSPSSLVPSQEEPRTPQTRLAHRVLIGSNIRHTPRRGVDNFRNIRTPQYSRRRNLNAYEDLETPRRRTVLLERRSTPVFNVEPLGIRRNAVEIDFFSEAEIFA